MNEALYKATDELSVFVNRAKELNESAKSLLEGLVKEDTDFLSSVDIHLPIMAERYKEACSMKEDYDDFTIKYKTLIDDMGGDIVKVKIDTGIGMDTLIKIIGSTLRKLIEIKRSYE